MKMGKDFYYDDTRLQRMFEELEPKARTRALRGAFRAAAAGLRKQVLTNLRASGLNSNRDVEKGVRSVVWKRNLGFRVTIGTKKYSKAAGSTDEAKRRRKGVVPLWAEGGTEQRYSVKKRSKMGFSVNTKGSNRGKLKPYEFMKRTEGDSEKIHQDLVEALVRNIERAARKHGAKVQ